MEVRPLIVLRPCRTGAAWPLSNAIVGSEADAARPIHSVFLLVHIVNTLRAAGLVAERVCARGGDEPKGSVK